MMRHLYVAFAVLLLILTTGVTGFSQRNAKSKDIVTRTIVGCTLGETTLEQIKENVQAQGGTIESLTDGSEGPRVKTMFVNNLMFWGKNRDEIMLKTVDNIFYMVTILISLGILLVLLN